MESTTGPAHRTAQRDGPDHDRPGPRSRPRAGLRQGSPRRRDRGKEPPRSRPHPDGHGRPPIARLKPEGPDGKLRIQYWSHRNRWMEVGDMGGLALPLDEAFETIAETEIFWTWT